VIRVTVRLDFFVYITYFSNDERPMPGAVACLKIVMQHSFRSLNKVTFNWKWTARCTL